MHLKYMWCLGRIPDPPHRPFDWLIIERIDLPETIAWTKLDDQEENKSLVNAAKEKGKDRRLCQWELLCFEESRGG